jgi:hypothetical protein
MKRQEMINPYFGTRSSDSHKNNPCKVQQELSHQSFLFFRLVALPPLPELWMAAGAAMAGAAA